MDCLHVFITSTHFHLRSFLIYSMHYLSWPTFFSQGMLCWGFVIIIPPTCGWPIQTSTHPVWVLSNTNINGIHTKGRRTAWLEVYVKFSVQLKLMSKLEEWQCCEKQYTQKIKNIYILMHINIWSILLYKI